jgi:hypothetical protein
MFITEISGNGPLFSSGLNLTIIVIFNKSNVKRNSISNCVEKTNAENPLTASSERQIRRWHRNSRIGTIINERISFSTRYDYKASVL